MTKAKITHLPQSKPEMTEEQKKEMALRSFVQKRNSVAEAIIFNAVQGNLPATDEGLELIDTAIAMADRYMEKAFGLKEGPKSE